MSSRNQAYTIYGIRRPGTTAIRYVGYTKRPLEVRLKAHLWNPLNEPMKKWFRRLGRDGVEPEMVALASSDNERKAKIIEKAWIASMSVLFGPLLFNRFGRGDTIFRDQLIRQARAMKKADWRKQFNTKSIIRRCRRNGRPYERFPSIYEADGKSGTVSFWAQQLGISRQRVHQRINKCKQRKVDIKYALTTPAGETMPCFK